MTASIRIIREIGELSALSPSWLRLLALSSVNEPALTPTWLLNWWRVFGGVDGRVLSVAAIEKEERLIGLAPLVSRRHWYRPGIPFRRLELLGSGEPIADEICSEYLGILCESGQEADVARLVANALVAGDLGDWDELVLPFMAQGQGCQGQLAAQLESHGIRTSMEVVGRCPFIRLPDSFESYLAGLTSSRRYHIRRSLRDYERWAAGTSELQVATSDAELADAYEALRRLHEQRWAVAGRSGVFASARFDEFHRSIIRNWRNHVELLVLHAHGVPVAALYNIVYGDKVYFYQSGRAIDVPKEVRVGTVSHALSIRHSIRLGRHEYDFLRGNSRYKLEFCEQSRKLVTLRAVRARVLEGMRQMVYGAADGIRAVRRAWQREAEDELTAA